MSGPKGEAACGNAATPKLTGPSKDNSGQSNAQGCAHDATRTELLPQGHQHHAQVTCALCGRFLRWVSRAELLERQRGNFCAAADVSRAIGLGTRLRQGGIASATVIRETAGSH